MTNPNDLLFLSEDADYGESEAIAMEPWRILIADDDRDVHDSTVFALHSLNILGRPLEFLHAFSAAETLALLREEPAVAVILLDVVMETEDAGLRIVETIRRELGLDEVRIILRTGQPGYAPEMEAISRYEINDYKTKSELTRIKLYTSLTSAIRSYDQLQRLNAGRLGLRRILDASQVFMSAASLHDFAEGVIVQFASFIGIEPMGLVCARSAGANGAAALHEIVGATGPHAHLLGQPLATLAGMPVHPPLQRCLDERRTIVAEPWIALFCPGRSGNDFAALVDTGGSQQEIDHNLVDLFCANIGLCGDNIALIGHLRDAATTDSLAKLPNRLAFIDAIEHKLKESDGIGQVVALLNVDCFAEMNDVLDSRYGDMLLQAIARYLREQLPGEVTVARVAGAGFGLLGSEISVNPGLLHALFRTPLAVDGIESLVSFSMGLVRLRDFQASGAELFQCASVAQKRAKANGQIGQTAYYTPQTRNEIRGSAQLLQELRMALQDEQVQFFLVYQPQIDLKSGKVVGVEALVRWKKRGIDCILPDRFIPIAEQSGLIVHLGNWVLKTALYDLRRLHQAGFEGLRMAVNVSAVQFRHPDFLADVDDSLRESEVEAQWLELEITESSALIGEALMHDILHGLKERQIAIAIDDFGTGYSSLSYLNRLPADRIKIDRSFISQIGNDKRGMRITDMVVPLGRQLGMKVLAEGVEAAAQAEHLRELDCDEIQGEYTARPMIYDNLLDWLTKQGGYASFRA